jgi:serine/threonine-protein kinase RsbW
MNSHDAIHLDLPASFKHLGMVRACLAELLAYAATPHEQTVYAVQLAVHEACTNIVEHAYAGHPGGRIGVTLALADHPRRLLIELRDTGAAYTPQRAALPDPHALQEGGYGQFLMHTLLDDVAYIPNEAGNTWRLVKLLDSEEGEPI